MRLVNNVRRWPRTFTAVLALAALEIAETLATANVDAKCGLHQLAILMVALPSFVVIAGFVYRWFMGDYRRVNLLVTLLDGLEGRYPVEPEPDVDEEEEWHESAIEDKEEQA